jgi:hypothetical protein
MRAAEDAIATDQYTIHTSTKDRRRAVLILRTTPPLVASISREPSFSGGVPDLIVQAVYEPKGDPALFAQELWEML